MKLDIIFAGTAKDPEQETRLLALLKPLEMEGCVKTRTDGDRTLTASTLVEALRRSDVVLLIGGLGCESKDFTTALLCEGLGLREEFCPAALEQMKKRYDTDAAALPKEDLKKVKIPAGAKAFLNRWGDCPGYALVAEDQCIAALPDGAAELSAMVEEKLVPFLQSLYAQTSQPITGQVFGLPLATAMKLAEPAGELAKISMKRERLGISVHILPEDEKRNTETAASLLQNALGASFFTQEQTLVQELLTAAQQKKIPMAFAEWEEQAGSHLFPGENTVQRLTLSRQNKKESGIPKKLFKKKKGVTAQMAIQMAKTARERFGATIGMAVTGTRSLDRHTDIAYAALCDQAKVWVARILIPEERLNLDQTLTFSAAVDFARRYVQNDPVFLARANGLMSSLGRKLSLVCTCTLQEDGTAVWKEFLPALEPAGIGEKPGKGKKRSKTPVRGHSAWRKAGKAVLVIFLSLLLLAAGAVGSFYWQAYRSGEIRTAMLSLYQNGAGDAVPDGYPAKYRNQFGLLWEQNQDVVGWISAPNTDLSFPVVQGPDNTFYSLRNFKKEPSLYGTAFLNSISSLEEDANLTLYGNNMEDGQMFAQLEHYRKLSYYREHPTFSFDTVYGQNNYKICAVFVVDTGEEDVFDYENFQNPQNEKEWETLAEEIKARSLICAPVDIEPGDRILTLSTAASDFEGARLLVIGRQTRDGEVKSVSVDNAVYNANPLLPEKIQSDNPGFEYPTKDETSFTPGSEDPAGTGSGDSGEGDSSAMESDSSPISSQIGSSGAGSVSDSTPASSKPSSSTPASSKPSSSTSVSQSQPPEVGPEPPSSSSSAPSSSSGGSSGGSSSSGSGSQTPSDGETFRVNGKDYDAYDAVCRVVAAELGNGNYESIKAQAVATYTLILKGNQSGKYPTGLVLGTPSSTVKQAVKEVWGEALYANGRLMDVFYFSLSAGRTNEPQDVWGSSVAGYGSVDSSWDENVSSQFERSVSKSKQTVIDRVWEYLGIDLTDVPVEDWFTVESYTSGGYNAKMTVGGYSTVQKSGSSAFRTGAAITGRILRENVFSLRSAAFTWEESGNNIIFTTKGYGHGVGMSQYGAIEMAKKGYGYVDILEYYYPGASVK